MDPIWLLKGNHNAPGWKPLEADARAEKIDWRLFDRDAWVLIKAAEAPTQYEGLVPGEPPDGLYVDQQGNHTYLVDRQEVRNGRMVIEALGDEAKKLLEELGDADMVLQRLGRAF